ncbi:hypothetical protein AAB992_05660 [Burkholderia contaminans]|uniref:hypothetical protein n=1 Tax=Burkholderia contaminans TaxID=488447 RepID=UPI002416E683|nr:hypothetical protein [Burkholderia contaminans]WFN10087.1 hypothetical protein LXE92_01170 [Burkholderia contaminans]
MDNAAVESNHQYKRLWHKAKRLNRLFLLTVALPTTISIVYFGLVASDIYVSESRFVIRSPQRQTQSSLVGAFLQGTGFSRSQDDTYPIIDYIGSRDALKELNQGKYIEQAYGGFNLDFLSRFSPFGFNQSQEALLRFYKNNIIELDFDSTSSIVTLKVRAFNSTYSQHINELLLEQSEHLINRMNERAAHDAVQFAQSQLNLAAIKAKDAAAALASYRNSFTVFDPDRQSALQLQQVSSLQNQLLTAQNQLIQLQALSPANPQISALKSNIDTLQRQITTATSGVAGKPGSLSDKAATYARLQLDSQLADKQLASAMASLDSAQAEAQRKQLYLERIVTPNKPDEATEPRRLRAIAATFMLGMISWGILTVLIAGIREHRD